MPKMSGLGKNMPTAPSSISVVIPVYNRWSTLARALTSVCAQSHPAEEIVVVDDGSDTPAPNCLRRQFADVQFLRQENRGVAHARNTGIKKCSGNWIALLDSDDEWEPCKLEKQVEHNRAHPSLMAVHTGEKWIRNSNEVIPPAYLDKSTNDLWERSLKNCLICPSSVFLHRRVFDEVGGFDESLAVCEDYDFWLRLLLRMDIGLVDKKLVRKHGGHADQLSTTTWGMDRYRVQSLEKILTTCSLSQEQEEALISTLTEKLSILADGAAKRGKIEQAKQYREVLQKYQPTPHPGNQARLNQ